MKGKKMKKIVLSLLAIFALSSYSPAHAGWGKFFGGAAVGSVATLALTNGGRGHDHYRRGSYDREVKYTRRGRAYVRDEFGNKIFLERN